jgi:hypothetical protein
VKLRRGCTDVRLCSGDLLLKLRLGKQGIHTEVKPQSSVIEGFSKVMCASARGACNKDPIPRGV